MPFKFKRLKIPDIVLIEPVIFEDERGYFLESYKYSEFKNNGIRENFVQDNQSFSKKNVLRGLHYQIHPMAQAKLIRCVKGRIFDVAVDIRKGSPYYRKWIGIILSEENQNILYIPAGFAHGFCVLSEYAIVFYKTSNEYSPQYERGIIWNDPEIKIEWPVKNPILSDKDKDYPTLNKAENNFKYEKGN
ncbi:dTDP-4-dehydrorhamnose 3,5-epimerase [Candidatus Aminicenantes bacterium AC-335-K20]|jgi:dTDP-4-dehydrorhamnose 3,5-epimerase|nr:dTDP-4-dehydrorhamnose 3,5-epimerase [SCandidatus Aminicenantes bacterium Aminicenantia_JdfR_composite]MCP2596534.1 dTDP-4-dehydrorhamnose 3,5-epimerase [Candidatus Aminicenantes bacterium AC-335-G13]MCP2605459.1 dTDP-4-dehydrorhamnose 3,5-epimerase [Candidatus Aminicenantes bacterium AC-335-O07]MCP2619252.1 dTDP-4-dehydrorhamnose 3,5-epimerase [Candidatus Aminicenantes bacterium AC-335-K20]